MSSSLSEHPREVSLSHITVKPVTTEPLGTIPVIVIVVALDRGVFSRTGDSGTEREEKISGILFYTVQCIQTGQPKATDMASIAELGNLFSAVPVTDTV